MTLREKQSVFCLLVSRLIQYAYSLGYELTFGETYRPPELAELYAARGLGIKGSLHTQRLAIDLNLFKDGKYLVRTEDYTKLGEFWESLSPTDNSYKCHWGGRFSRGDGNHFSIGHGGKK